MSARAPSARVFAAGGLALALPGLGCPEPSGEGPCAPAGPVELEVADRGEPTLDEGDVLEVFFAPQGGVFSELDLRVTGLDPGDLEKLVVDLRDVSDQAQLAQEAYGGDAIERMFVCRPDGAWSLERVPVAVLDDDLERLDQTRAQLRVELVTGEATTTFERTVVLEASEF